MRPWEVIDQAPVPYDDSTVYLSQRGSSFAIHVESVMLMDNIAHGSEVALAEMACERVTDAPARRIVVGGLGMGFTMAAALRCVPGDGEVITAELIEAVVRWNRGPAGRASGHPQRDPRARIHVGDVADLFTGPNRGYCAILLDVDNGPRALTRPINGWLYTQKGLSRARRSLRPGGVLAIWSAYTDDSLTRRLRGGGFEVDVVPFFEAGRNTHDGKNTDTLWFARRV